MKNILMIYPEFPATYWSFKYALKFIGKKSTGAPLGLITVASLIPEEYNIKLVDMNVETLQKSDIINSDLVFISGMMVQKESFHKVIKLCNELNKTVVAGGPYATSSHDSIEGVDHFIINEAEFLMDEFFHDYESGKLKKMYVNENKPEMADVPVPRYDLLKVHDYSSLPVQFSRGCPFNCEFCDIIEMFGRVPRTKDPDQFVNELEVIYKTGFDDTIFIVDDNFIGHKGKAKKLVKRIIEWQESRNYPFDLYTEASINLASDDELLDLMVKAGFIMVFIGIETPDEETLKLMHKEQNLKHDLIESVKKIQEKGMEVSAGLVVGFDSDREDIFERQIEFIEKSAIPMSMVSLLGAMPNTQLFRRLKKEGRLIENWQGNNTHDLRLSFKPKMSEVKLINGYKKIISEIYSPENYFNRCLTFIKRLPDIEKVNKTINVKRIKSLILSLIKQSFSYYGKFYIRYVYNVLKYRPQYIVEAVTLAVEGYHFFKITKDILQSDEFSIDVNAAMESLNKHLSLIQKKPETRIPAEMKRFSDILLLNIQKKHNRLSDSMKIHQKKRIMEFEEYCEQLISNQS